jgi:hypothetical protein
MWVTLRHIFGITKVYKVDPEELKRTKFKVSYPDCACNDDMLNHEMNKRHTAMRPMAMGKHGMITQVYVDKVAYNPKGSAISAHPDGKPMNPPEMLEGAY